MRPVDSSLEISATYGRKARNSVCSSVTVVWEHKVMSSAFVTLEFLGNKDGNSMCNNNYYNY